MKRENKMIAPAYKFLKRLTGDGRKYPKRWFTKYRPRKQARIFKKHSIFYYLK